MTRPKTIKCPVFEIVPPPPDETTDDQRATYYAVIHLLAEARQPQTVGSMRKRIDELMLQVNTEARRLKVPFEQWEAECDRRLRAILVARGSVE